MKIENLKSRAGWFLSEILVIVVGVLIAIWLNALYSDYSDRKEEQAYLHRLASDFDETVDRFHVGIEGTTRIRDNMLEILRLANSPPNDSVADSIRMRMPNVFAMFTAFNPVLGTYQELISEGKLELISDDSLRMALVAFEAGLEGMRSVWIEGWEQYNLIQVPFQMKNMDLLEDYDGNYGGMELPASSYPEVSDVFWTREFSNLLTVTAISRQDQIIIATSQLERAEAIRSRINSSLE